MSTSMASMVVGSTVVCTLKPRARKPSFMKVTPPLPLMGVTPAVALAGVWK